MTLIREKLFLSTFVPRASLCPEQSETTAEGTSDAFYQNPGGNRLRRQTAVKTELTNFLTR